MELASRNHTGEEDGLRDPGARLACADVIDRNRYLLVLATYGMMSVLEARPPKT
jgi:hypothetical protein